MFMYVHVRMWICGIFVFTYVHLGACLLVRRIFDIMQYGTYDHFFFVIFFSVNFCAYMQVRRMFDTMQYSSNVYNLCSV